MEPLGVGWSSKEEEEEEEALASVQSCEGCRPPNEGQLSALMFSTGTTSSSPSSHCSGGAHADAERCGWCAE
jgi:hypothetical protein